MMTGRYFSIHCMGASGALQGSVYLLTPSPMACGRTRAMSNMASARLPIVVIDHDGAGHGAFLSGGSPLDRSTWAARHRTFSGMAESAAELRGRCEYDADAAYNLSFMLAQVRPRRKFRGRGRAPGHIGTPP